MCTSMIAFVLGVILARTTSGSIVNDSSISQSTGTAREYTIEDIEATKVYPGTRTSSPRPMPSAAIAQNKGIRPGVDGDSVLHADKTGRLLLGSMTFALKPASDSSAYL